MKFPNLLLAVCCSLAALSASAEDGDWVFLPGDYTHSPNSGKRVAQYAPNPHVYYTHQGNYAKNAIRYTNSTLRVGDSVDRYNLVETWGNGALALGTALLWDPVDYHREVEERRIRELDRQEDRDFRLHKKLYDKALRGTDLEALRRIHNEHFFHPDSEKHEVRGFYGDVPFGGGGYGVGGFGGGYGYGGYGNGGIGYGGVGYRGYGAYKEHGGAIEVGGGYGQWNIGPPAPYPYLNHTDHDGENRHEF